MKIILIRDVENLGEKGDIKKVADGYARNFLLPNKLVKLANKKNLKEIERQKELTAIKSEGELKLLQKSVSKIDGQEIEISVKLKKNGEIYSSLSPLKISQAFKKKGLDIKKTQIKLKEAIKEVGEYPIAINFSHGLEAEVKVIIVEKKTKK